MKTEPDDRSKVVATAGHLGSLEVYAQALRDNLERVESVIRELRADLGLSPLETRQPREHAVPCRLCRAMTWNVTAVCDTHDDRVTG